MNYGQLQGLSGAGTAYVQVDEHSSVPLQVVIGLTCEMWDMRALRAKKRQQNSHLTVVRTHFEITTVS
jgi:hypothetical protein